MSTVCGVRVNRGLPLARWISTRFFTFGRAGFGVDASKICGSILEVEYKVKALLLLKLGSN